MPILHIEHPITDIDTWKAAFDRFAQARVAAGVRAYRIAQPVHDDTYIVVDLDFDDHAAAEKFLTFLRSNIWSSPDASPGLAGEPHTQILVEVETGTN